MRVNGKAVADHIKEEVIKRNSEQTKKVCFTLFDSGLTSKKFVQMKCKFAKEAGILATVREYNNLSESEIEKEVAELAKSGYDGIVIQLPLPQGINTQKILNLVPVEQDIDILGNESKELYLTGDFQKMPPVARAVQEILQYYNIDISGKKILVVGRGKLVGEPVSIWLRQMSADFNIVDINTQIEERNNLFLNADIIISGAGVPHMIKPSMIKDEVVIVDAGTSEANGKILGDADPSCEDKSCLFTPVPGGVGPVTVASLFLNI